MFSLTEKYISAASVVTIWPSPDKAREVDAYATADQPSMHGWLQQMTTVERKALCFEGRVETQLLYGEEVEVDDIQGSWAKVRAIHQPYRGTSSGYPGWVPYAQLRKQPQVHAIGYVRVKEARTPLLAKKDLTQLVTLSFNTILPVVAEHAAYYEVSTAHGEAFVFKQGVDFSESYTGFTKKDAQQVALEMMKFLDTPYFWGGMSSYGYDCSGLSYNAMKACGYQVARDASDQAKGGQEIITTKRDEWRVGDLVFFTKPPAQKVTHVGIYLGDDLLLHSTIYSDRVEIIRLSDHTLNDEITSVRRYIEEAK